MEGISIKIEVHGVCEKKCFISVTKECFGINTNTKQFKHKLAKYLTFFSLKKSFSKTFPVYV